MPTGHVYRYVEVPEKKAPEPALVIDWRDTEAVTRWPQVSLAASAVIAAGIAVAVVSPTAAWFVFIAGIAWMFWRFRQSPSDAITLRVDGAMLVIERADHPPRSIRLANVREVEIDRKSIRRVTYHQDVGAVTPHSSLSGDVDVARIAIVLEGETARTLVTESYGSYGECMERFGKVRKFLRTHGWLPIDERIPDDAQAAN